MTNYSGFILYQNARCPKPDFVLFLKKDFLSDIM